MFTQPLLFKDFDKSMLNVSPCPFVTVSLGVSFCAGGYSSRGRQNVNTCVSFCYDDIYPKRTTTTLIYYSGSSYKKSTDEVPSIIKNIHVVWVGRSKRKEMYWN